MKLTGFSFFCYCFLQFFGSVLLPASGKPLQTRSPEPVSAIAGKDVILPCSLTTSVNHSRVVAVEWSRVDGPSPVTVLVVRNGKELVKEKAPEYQWRTAIVEDGSLKLLAVQQPDSGTYRCVLLRGSSLEDKVFVSLIVGQMSEVNLSVRRTSTNKLFVHCESSGWSPEPVLSLLDSRRNVLATQTESLVRPDKIYSVRAFINVATAPAEATLTGNGTVICRVEIPGTNLSNENKISVTDEFDALQTGHDCYYILVFAIALPCVIIGIVVFVVPVQRIEKLRSSLQLLTVFCIGLNTKEKEGQPDQSLLEGNQRYTEYGDISKVETRGASEHTARGNNLLSLETEASNELAGRDLEGMLKHREKISSVGETLGIHPALIAAIISRQSQVGTRLNASGYGQNDPNCFGLMQINKHYHAVKGGPFSQEHIDQGVTFLIQLIKTMRRTKPDWSEEQQLKGALACYIAGEDRVIPLAYEEVDSVTPNGDFANDVVARAQWFARNGF